MTSFEVPEREPDAALGLMLATPPVAFHGAFAEITHSATAALLLSFMVEEIEQPEISTVPADEIVVDDRAVRERTGLSVKEMASARRTLLRLGFVSQIGQGQRQFRIHLPRICASLRKAASTRWTSCHAPVRAH